MFEELQDYKVKSVKGYKIISIWKGRVTRLQERKLYKSLCKGEGERAILDLSFESENWTGNLDLKLGP